MQAGGQGTGQPRWQEEVKAVSGRCLPGERDKILPISPNRGWFQNSEQSLSISSSRYCSFSKPPFFFFCGIGLVASIQPLEFSYLHWLLVGGHDDPVDGPHKSVLLGILLILSLSHHFSP